MRSWRIILLSLILLCISTPASMAQLCTEYVQSSNDLVRVVSFKGRAGSEVLMPLRMANDSIVRAFSFQINFDTSKLTPVTDASDTTSIQWVAVNRFLQTTTAYDDYGFPYDSVTTKLSVGFYIDPNGIMRKNVLNCLSLPTLTDIDSLARGDGVIFYVKFRVKSGLADGATANFTFYKVDEYVTDNSTTPPTEVFVGCKLPQMSQAWDQPNATPRRTDDISVYPSFPLAGMVFQVGSEPPAIASFTASPNSLNGSGQSKLKWSATNADSVVISGPGTTRIGVGAAIDSMTLTVSTTTQFTATAYGSGTPVTANATVTVIQPDNDLPVVTSTKMIDSVHEGQSIAFTVTATDDDPVDGSITLMATNIPTGASFPTQINVGSVSGVFSWAPNVGQNGTYSIIFKATDALNGSTSITVSIKVLELEFDRLFSTSAPAPTGVPIGGLRGTNGLYFPINLISSKSVYGIQFDLTYPYQQLQIDSVVRSGRIPDYSVYDNIGATPGIIRVVTFGLNNEAVQTDTTTAVMWLVATIDSSATPWSSIPMNMKNGRESVDPDPNVASMPLVTDSGIIEVDNPGDVNLDKFIDVGDVVNIVASIIGNFTLNPRQFATADIIVNDAVNVFDLVGDINLIYGIPPSPSPAPAENAIVSLTYDDLNSGQSEVMQVKSEVPTQIAAVEMEVAYDPRSVALGRPIVTKDYRNFILQYRDNGNGRMKVLLYHGAGAMASTSDLIQVGTAALISIPITAKSDVATGNKSQIRLTEVLLSTPTATSVTVEGVTPSLPQSFMLKQNYPNPFNPETVLEFSIGQSGESASSMRDVTLEIYNVIGQKIRTLMSGKLPPGDHKLVWNATSESGSRVASGIYLCRLKVDGESQTRKMVFLK